MKLKDSKTTVTDKMYKNAFKDDQLKIEQFKLSIADRRAPFCQTLKFYYTKEKRVRVPFPKKLLPISILSILFTCINKGKNKHENTSGHLHLPSYPRTKRTNLN